MRWQAGTSGFSYKAWKGPFYPEDLADGDMLGYYASKLPAVEINNTFYRMPRTSVLESWANAVPEHFRFVVKASRRITHMQRLKDAEDATGYLVDTLGALGPKLGAVLFQLPPNLRLDLVRLEKFLALLPRHLPRAFEFRHESWHTPAVHALLAQTGTALCISDGESETTPELVATATWTYLRLRRPGYTEAALHDWDRRAREAGAEGGFAFFKHEDEGAGPALAERFLALTGDVRAPAAAPRAAPRRKQAAKAGEASAKTPRPPQQTPARKRPGRRRA